LIGSEILWKTIIIDNRSSKTPPRDKPISKTEAKIASLGRITKLRPHQQLFYFSYLFIYLLIIRET